MIRQIHHVGAWALISVNAFAGFWCLAAYAWPRLRSKALYATVILGQVLAVVQAIVGTILANTPGAQLRDMHALYGFSTVITVGILYSYRNSGFMKGKELLLYGFGSLFIMGLGIRNLYL